MNKLQLIVLGYAGGEASNFNVLLPYLGNDIILSVIEYRGRGSRRKEAYYETCEEMENDIAEQIKKVRLPNMPYAILGYSMGAQNVYEIFAKGLVQETPLCIFVAAHEPPDIPCAGKKLSIEDDDDFMNHVKIYGGMDMRLLQDSRFAGIYLPRMKADFSMLHKYVFNGKHCLFPSNLVVLYCEKDTSFEKIQGWKRFAQGDVSFYELGNSHFFFRADTEKFSEIILTEIQKIIG